MPAGDKKDSSGGRPTQLDVRTGSGNARQSMHQRRQPEGSIQTKRTGNDSVPVR